MKKVLSASVDVFSNISQKRRDSNIIKAIFSISGNKFKILFGSKIIVVENICKG